MSSHARKKTMDVEDVRLSASQMQERQGSGPPARHVVSEVRLVDQIKIKVSFN